MQGHSRFRTLGSKINYQNHPVTDTPSAEQCRLNAESKNAHFSQTPDTIAPAITGILAVSTTRRKQLPFFSPGALFDTLAPERIIKTKRNRYGHRSDK
jgi:hypothetical protein